MQNYLVTVRDSLGELHSTLCKGRGEFANLLNHLDEDKYHFESVKVINDFSSDVKTFCKKTNIETGG